MMDVFPDRAFDVGIAEQHAVTLAAGMATQGLIPFCNIYSTFLQRAYDQIIHDVALQNLPVIFCLDRSGLVGEDGATHHGVFDMAYLRCIPNMIIAAPRNEITLRNLIFTAQLGKLKNPLAIRYPRGRGTIIDWQVPLKEIILGKGEKLKHGENIAVLSIGSTAKNVTEAISDLPISHYDMAFIKPLDEPLLHTIFESHKIVITIENGTIVGGFGSAIAEFKAQFEYNNTLQILGVPDQFIEQGTIEELEEITNMSPKKIRDFVVAIMNS